MKFLKIIKLANQLRILTLQVIISLLFLNTQISFSQNKINWEGTYVGVDLGIAKGKDHGYEDDGSRYLNKNDLQGAIYGFHLGYNFPLDNLIGKKGFIFSPLVEYKKGRNLESSITSQLDLRDGVTTKCKYCLKSTFIDSYSLLGKFGYLLNEYTQINIVAGLTDIRMKRNIYYESYSIVDDSVTDQIRGVPTYGLGYESIINNNLSFVTDFRYLKSKTKQSSSDYDDEFYNYRQTSVTAGINYRF
jgi:opacity protein-like surface antigen